jgi:hypothetical protein
MDRCIDIREGDVWVRGYGLGGSIDLCEGDV